MEHILITAVLAFLSGIVTYYFGLKAIESRNNKSKEITKINQKLKEAKETAFAVIAGMVGGVPALYSGTSEPKYIAFWIGFGVWVLIAIYSARVCIKMYPSFFENE